MVQGSPWKKGVGLCLSHEDETFKTVSGNFRLAGVERVLFDQITPGKLKSGTVELERKIC